MASEANKLKILIKKKEDLFLRVQSTYDLTKSKSFLSDDTAKNSFLIKCKSLEDTKLLFAQTVDSINELQLNIDEDASPDFQALNSFDDVYCNILAWKDRLLPSSSAIASGSNNSSTAQSPSMVPKIKLPPLQLPRFSGKPAEWNIFYQTFKAAICDNQLLNDADRVRYLTGCLSDKALSMISGIPPLAENFSSIWDTLVDRFQDHRALATSYLSQMLDYKSSNKETSFVLDDFLQVFVASADALKSLKLKDTADFILIHLALNKLPPDTVKQFELSFKISGSTETSNIPIFSQLTTFLKDHVKMLARTPSKSIASTSTNMSNNRSTHSFVANKITSQNIIKCPICCKSHHAFSCHDFHKLTPQERFNLARNKSLCINCLSQKHNTRSCKSKHSCSICHSPHHTLLHFKEKSHSSYQASPIKQTSISNQIHSPQNDNVSVPPTESPPATSLSASSIHPTTSILMSTAQVLVKDSTSNFHLIRVLLDSASSSNFITLSCCNSLHLPKQKFISSVSGIGHVTSPIRYKTSVSFKSRFDDTQIYTIDAFVLDKITNETPSVQVDPSLLTHLEGVRLADDTFYTPGSIELLIGASMFPILMGPGKILGPVNLPVALQSSLGYIVMGQYDHMSAVSNPQAFCTALEPESLTDLITRFLEDMPDSESPTSPSEDECENIFVSSTTRTSEGRYVVSLPFRSDPSLLGNSYELAVRRFLALEKQLNADPIKKKLYHDCIQDYINQGHMSLSHSVSYDDCFLPHHSVIKPDSTSTKLRVVWNASAPTTTGLSLNDILHIGPKLHNDLACVLLSFRLFPITLTADMRQMYRQILVHKDHRKYQTILWRFNSNDKIDSFQLNTVTFGVRPAPFLALRTVRQLCHDYEDQYPFAAKIASHDLYCDDLATSVSTLTEAIKLYKDLIELFSSGGFDLVKWCSNSSQVMTHIPTEKQLHDSSLDFLEDNSIKVLGLQWSSNTDSFTFRVTPPNSLCTKRNILSTLGRIFDPLGFLGPVSVFAKMLIRDMWDLQLDWDDLLDNAHPVFRKWTLFIHHLPRLEEIRIPRHVFVFNNSPAELIGFCDASAQAYGAVVYIRVPASSSIKTSLLMSKTRLASRKNTITIPRLELCAADLLAQLIRYIIDSYSSRYSFIKILAFSDSSVVLHWISSSPTKWNIFVSRRISRIHEICPSVEWRHVRGHDNPADCLSRGILPHTLVSHPLWFSGPLWLKESEELWPSVQYLATTTDHSLEEKRNAISLNVSLNKPCLLRSLIDKKSNYNRLVRIVACILKWKQHPSSLRTSAEEILLAEYALIYYIQRQHFSSEITALSNNLAVQSQIRKLHPFMKAGLIRVGGRLVHSSLQYDQKHPLLLPKSDHFVDILIDHYHRSNFHAGPNLTLSLLRQRFWILGGRSRVRSIIQSCNLCFRHRPKPIFPLMGELPAPRINQCKPFFHTGVDYAGPFDITISRRRGARTQKAYICLFVCLTTKALHLELASDLSTPTFLNCLKRFLSRRGPIKILYSDCGTNFIGARSYLNDVYSLINSDAYLDEFSAHLANNSITFRLNPPSAPHFGSMWETNVKSVKSHLSKVIGLQILSFEELYTVIVQIEALLNSRPLCVQSSDPGEPTSLTPAHFLTQVPLVQLPAPNLQDDNINRLTRFQLLDRILQDFWKRWHLEYLHTLQTRAKWNTDSHPIKIGTVVVLKKDNIPPLTWPLGVVEAVFPGADGKVRVASVRVGNTTYRRPVVKLCPLPSQ